MNKLQHCVYVLQSDRDKNLYIGYTTDLKRRLTEHIQGRSPSTSVRRPFALIFCEFYRSNIDALRRERYFKTTSGKRALRLMLQCTLEEGCPAQMVPHSF